MFLNQEKFEQLLLANWTTFLNQNLLLKKVLENVRDSELPKTIQEDIPPVSTKITITKFGVKDKTEFELWIEFSVPKDQGVAIGSHVYTLRLDGELILKENYGRHFLVGN